MQRQRLHNQIEHLLQSLNNEQEGTMPQDESPQPTNEDEPVETIHVYFVRERDDSQATVVEATLAPSQKAKHPSSLFIATTLIFVFMLPLSSILFQVYLAFHPPIATVTILPKTKTVTLAAVLPLGRMLPPLTVSQSQTVPTTGKGHQDATAATGSITFYNGLFTSQFIPPGTILTDQGGRQVITDEEAALPAANPPVFGQVTVAAHARSQGGQGNIPAYDINQACCANAVLAKNTQRFTGGQDERSYQTVAPADIAHTATPLKTTLAHSLQGALQGQVQPHEQLFLLVCPPTITSDHQAGQEATSVTVTVSENCRAVVYNSEEVERKATALLTHQAAATLGAAYSLFGTVHVRSIQATITQTPTPLVFFSFRAFGTWIYGLSPPAQQQMKRLIAGKTKQQALHLLASLPGVARAAISWGDDTRLPKDTGDIHLSLFVV
jgi:Baseplate J-like protein